MRESALHSLSKVDRRLESWRTEATARSKRPTPLTLQNVGRAGVALRSRNTATLAERCDTHLKRKWSLELSPGTDRSPRTRPFATLAPPYIDPGASWPRRPGRRRTVGPTRDATIPTRHLVGRWYGRHD